MVLAEHWLKCYDPLNKLNKLADLWPPPCPCSSVTVSQVEAVVDERWRGESNVAINVEINHLAVMAAIAALYCCHVLSPFFLLHILALIGGRRILWQRKVQAIEANTCVEGGES